MFFAFTGYARLATLGEEVAEPRRTIPLAIMLALGGAAALYFAVAFVAVGVLGADRMAAVAAPIEEAARTVGVPGLPTLVTAGATAAMLGVLLSQQLGISRMMMAMARRRDLPGFLARVHPVRAVPDRAVLLTGLIIAGVAMLGSLDLVVAGAAFTILLYYTITNAAALRLPAEDRIGPRWAPVAGLVVCLVLAGSLQPGVIAAGLVLLAAGLALKLAAGAARSRPTTRGRSPS
jgi:APA family basic amino acid/polyamine antiporter